MPDSSPQTQPSRQVKRIREILVGRQMQNVEQRLDLLEAALQPMPIKPEPALLESQLAELRRDGEEAVTGLRDEIDAARLRQLEETRRLAQQIQTVARSRSDAVRESRKALEQDIGKWFGSWQGKLQQQLQQREKFLITELRTELSKIRSTIDQQQQTHRPPAPDLSQVRAALEQLATTSRHIADQLGAIDTHRLS